MDYDIVIDIEIDVSGLDFNEGQFLAGLARAMSAMGTSARDFWYSEAGRRLNTSRVEYQKAITLDSTDKNSFTLSLTGDSFIPSAVEGGTPAYNMHIAEGMIAPLNVARHPFFATTGGGTYRTGNGVPWKHPGFPGVFLLDTVIEELDSRILMEHLGSLIERV